MADQHAKYNENFKDAKAMSAVLDSEWREGWQYVDEVMAAIVTRDDLKIVDLGAGTGYFTRRLAKALPKGRVHAIDPVQSMVDWMDENIVTGESLKNVTTKVVTFEDPLLGEVPFEMDLLLIGYTYHHIGPLDVRVSYMRDKVRPKLPKDALVVFIDFEATPQNMPDEIAQKLKGDGHAHGDQHDGSPEHPDFITPEQLKKEMEDAGFTFVTDYGYDHKPSYMLAFKLKT